MIELQADCGDKSKALEETRDEIAAKTEKVCTAIK